MVLEQTMSKRVQTRWPLGVGAITLLIFGTVLGITTIADSAQSRPNASVTASDSPSTTGIPCPPTPPGEPAPPCKNGLAEVPPASQSQWPSSGTAISQSDAIADARRVGSSDAATAPAYAEQTTYGAAAALIGEAPNPSLALSTSVWVVTVDASPGGVNSWTSPVPIGQSQPTYTPPSEPTFSKYTLILDAFNGTPIDVCAGCASLNSSG
jgi:hypothetical protein